MHSYPLFLIQNMFYFSLQSTWQNYIYILSTYPTNLYSLPRSTYEGICKEKSKTSSPKIYLQVTLDIMVQIKSGLSKNPINYQTTTIWAVCCTVFLGFLHVSKFTCICMTQILTFPCQIYYIGQQTYTKASVIMLTMQ